MNEQRWLIATAALILACWAGLVIQLRTAPAPPSLLTDGSGASLPSGALHCHNERVAVVGASAWLVCVELRGSSPAEPRMYRLDLLRMSLAPVTGADAPSRLWPDAVARGPGGGLLVLSDRALWLAGLDDVWTSLGAVPTHPDDRGAPGTLAGLRVTDGEPDVVVDAWLHWAGGRGYVRSVRRPDGTWLQTTIVPPRDAQDRRHQAAGPVWRPGVGWRGVWLRTPRTAVVGAPVPIDVVEVSPDGEVDVTWNTERPAATEAWSVGQTAPLVALVARADATSGVAEVVDVDQLLLLDPAVGRIRGYTIGPVLPVMTSADGWAEVTLQRGAGSDGVDPVDVEPGVLDPAAVQAVHVTWVAGGDEATPHGTGGGEATLQVAVATSGAVHVLGQAAGVSRVTVVDGEVSVAGAWGASPVLARSWSGSMLPRFVAVVPAPDGTLRLVHDGSWLAVDGSGRRVDRPSLRSRLARASSWRPEVRVCAELRPAPRVFALWWIGIIAPLLTIVLALEGRRRASGAKQAGAAAPGPRAVRAALCLSVLALAVPWWRLILGCI